MLRCSVYYCCLIIVRITSSQCMYLTILLELRYNIKIKYIINVGNRNIVHIPLLYRYGYKILDHYVKMNYF